MVKEQGLRKLTVTDCSAAVLAVAIDWMYGFGICEGLDELEDLLVLAARFLMEELKLEVGRRLALRVTKGNYRCQNNFRCSLLSFQV